MEHEAVTGDGGRQPLMNLLISPEERSKKAVSEAAVEKIVEQMGHLWRGERGEPIGLDGRIEILGPGRELTGLVIEVQVKSGRSYLTNKKAKESKSRRVSVESRKMRLDKKYRDYFSLIRHAPVLIVWYDPLSENCFWGQFVRNTISYVLIRDVFDRYAARAMARLARDWHDHHPQISYPPEPKISLRHPKQGALQYYKQWRDQECISPAFGTVRISLKGWRHITGHGRSQSDIMTKLRLLGAARSILETITTRVVCRIVRSTPVPTIYYKQTARVIFHNRSDAIVSVITEAVGNGPITFISVFESRKGVEGQ